MKDWLFVWLESLGVVLTPLLAAGVVASWILMTSVIIHLLLHKGVLRLIEQYAKQSETWWKGALVRHRLFKRLTLTLQGFILLAQTRIWLNPDGVALPVVQEFLHLWVTLFSVLSLFSLLDTVEYITLYSSRGRRMPVRGVFQSIKLAAGVLGAIYAISLIIGKSPAILLSGLGAMTAVLLLVFRDSILGLVAGIQLSANDMLAEGDWLEMPKYGADGEVIDISLTTVKVRNWDKTISTIPTYAMISDSFKNWRGMSEAGGRRIKRAVYIDATSVRFLNNSDIDHLRRARLLSDYIENKLQEIKTYNTEQNFDADIPVNGRRLTNLGTFRAYLTAYVKTNPRIHSGMTQMVRQLNPGPEGIPLEIYAFTTSTEWLVYESIQGDIFDHIFAVLPEFDLRVYQNPTGHDMRRLIQSAPMPALPAAPAETVPSSP
jgi:miniconductance mechanosensitive channel